MGRQLYTYAHGNPSRLVAIDEEATRTAHNEDRGFVIVDYFEKQNDRWTRVDRGNVQRQFLTATDQRLPRQLYTYNCERTAVIDDAATARWRWNSRRDNPESDHSRYCVVDFLVQAKGEWCVVDRGNVRCDLLAPLDEYID